MSPFTARGHCQRGPRGHQRTLAGCSRHGKGLDARRAGRESLPLHAPGDVPRQQAGLERGWLGRDAWREVRCPTQAECPGCQVPEVRGRCWDEGAEVCDGSAASQPPAAQPGAAWGPVTYQGTRIQGPQPLGGQVCPETGSVSVQPLEGEQAQPDRPPLPRKCGCDSGKASCGRRGPCWPEGQTCPGPSQGRGAEALASPDLGPFAGCARAWHSWSFPLSWRSHASPPRAPDPATPGMWPGSAVYDLRSGAQGRSRWGRACNLHTAPHGRAGGTQTHLCRRENRGSVR